MGRERFNAKARAGASHKKKKKRQQLIKKTTSVTVSGEDNLHQGNYNQQHAENIHEDSDHDHQDQSDQLDHSKDTEKRVQEEEEEEDLTYSGTNTAVPLILLPEDSRKQRILDQLPEPPEGKLSSKKKKRLEKFIEKQLKKEERSNILAQLSNTAFSSDLLRSSKTIGRANLSKKEKLKQALKEHKLGVPFSDPNNRLFVEKIVDEEEEEETAGLFDIPKEEDDSGSDNDDEEEDNQRLGKSGDNVDHDYDDGYDDNDGDIDLSSFMKQPSTVSTNVGGFGSALKPSSSASAPAFGSALKRKAEDLGDSAINSVEASNKKKKKKQKKKSAGTAEKPRANMLSDSDEEDNDSQNSDGDETSEQPQSKKSLWKLDVVSGETALAHFTKPPANPPKPEKLAPASTIAPAKPSKPAFYVPVNRPEAISIARAQLPVVGEEQPIMETILAHDCTILCGETGSGKTTQVPQFLYEAGFGDPRHPTFPGIIGVTQPRRVAAVSMAQRVAEEMGFGSVVAGGMNGPVSYQIRYDAATVSPNTRIKFMTDGVLLREVAGGSREATAGGGTKSDSADKQDDLLLSKYSCIIIDEAHERTVGTDVLIGWLTRIVKLRNGGSIKGIGPLKLVIMSATLRVEDFTLNKTLFPSEPPPVVKVDGRQYKVTIHYNRVTPETDYVSEAFKKVSKIHAKLPHGGILVFLTGQSEISTLVRKLRKSFGANSNNKANGQSQSRLNLEKEKNQLELEKPDAVNGAAEDIFAEAEDAQDFDDFVDDNDDYDMVEQVDDDDEEEEVEILNGEEGDEEQIEQEDSSSERLALHVLPLYSQLPTAAQMRVFESPPPGTRLCVVATNVAETSLTIPGIKYVVDCGKVKERRYDLSTGVQTFQVGWTSRASADQRAGRAGRVGPGHCYRLFSSAVYAHYFEEFSKPEILRVPIEGVILQMKAMGINNVINFPFPTPPSRDSLRSGETLLLHLGALTSQGSLALLQNDGKSSITELGMVLSKFPVSPRFGKMMVIAAKQSERLLQYTIAIGAGLSVGDPFVRDEEITGLVNDRRDKDEASDDDEDEKSERSRKRAEWYRIINLFGGDTPTSDVLRLLRAIGAYSAAFATSIDAGKKFAESHFLKSKSMDEIQKLREQLISLASEHILKSRRKQSNLALPPPNETENSLLRQIILAGFPDRIARLDHEATSASVVTSKKRATPLYATMWSGPNEIFVIHASSALARLRPAPEWITYEEIAGKEERISADTTTVFQSGVTPTGQSKERYLLKNVTIISDSWLQRVGPKTLLRIGKPVEQPEPHYDFKKDYVVGFTTPNYGPKQWELPMCELKVEGKDAYTWFARALLEGKVQPGRSRSAKRKSSDGYKDLFTLLMPYLVAKPSVMTKPWAKVQTKVTSFVSALSAADVSNRETLAQKWSQDKSFLLQQYLAWLPQEFHIPISTLWPPVMFVSDLEVIPGTLAASVAQKAKDKVGLVSKVETILKSLGVTNNSRLHVVDAESEADSD